MKQLDPKRYLQNKVTYPVIRVCHCSQCNGVMWGMNRLGEWNKQ